MISITIKADGEKTLREVDENTVLSDLLFELSNQESPVFYPENAMVYLESDNSLLNLNYTLAKNKVMDGDVLHVSTKTSAG